MVHSVYFWLKDEAKSKRAEFEQGLEDLCKISLIRQSFVGRPSSTAARPVVDHSYDYALITFFDSVADQDAYQVYPDHNVFVARFKDWWAKVVVYDADKI